MNPANRPFGIAIHGGTGVTPRAEMTADRERALRDTLAASVSAGWGVLRDGGSSVSAVEAAIRVMEDSPLFNAGKGASYNRAGFHELDAAIMDGGTLAAGAVGAVRHVRNPIALARLVMERSPHVLMVGEGAEAFALEQGVALTPASYFFTEHKWQSLQGRLEREAKAALAAAVAAAQVPPFDRGLSGTVGAVALDRAGTLAAGTSTGGREGKLPGRLGDSPILGAGTYASNDGCAVSCTGDGELVLRLCTAKEANDLVALAGRSLVEATSSVVAKVTAFGGSLGLVAIDRGGRIALPFNGDGMYRGYAKEDGEAVVGIYTEGRT